MTSAVIGFCLSIGGSLQNILPLQKSSGGRSQLEGRSHWRRPLNHLASKHLLTATVNGFRLPIGGGLQNILPPNKTSGCRRQTGGGSHCRQFPNQLASKISSDGGPQWHSPPDWRWHPINSASKTKF